MKKKKTDFKKLSLSKETISNIDSLKGGTARTDVPTGVCPRETFLITACYGFNECMLFDTRAICNNPH